MAGKWPVRGRDRRSCAWPWSLDESDGGDLVGRRSQRAELSEHRGPMWQPAWISRSRVSMVARYDCRCHECDGEVRAGGRIFLLSMVGIRCFACGPWPTDLPETRVWE